MSDPPRLRASALRLRRFRLPLVFALAVGFAGGCADGYRSHAFGGSCGFVLRPHLAGEFRNVTCVPPHAARTNHCGGVCTALHSFQRTPPRLPDTKKGDGFPSPLRVSNSYFSSPATTVSSVELSNALAASVTGR